MRFRFVLFLFLIIVSCGDKKTNSSTGNKVNITNGTYSFTTEDILFLCTDGGHGTVQSTAFNMLILISGNTITINNLSGVVQSDGSFIANSYDNKNSSSNFGQTSTNYHLEGKFSETGWSGKYNYSVYFSSYFVTCNYETTFSGIKQL